MQHTQLTCSKGVFYSNYPVHNISIDFNSEAQVHRKLDYFQIWFHVYEMCL